MGKPQNLAGNDRAANEMVHVEPPLPCDKSTGTSKRISSLVGIVVLKAKNMRAGSPNFFGRRSGCAARYCGEGVPFRNASQEIGYPYFSELGGIGSAISSRAQISERCVRKARLYSKDYRQS